MTTKILLFALLCGALDAQTVTAYQSTLSAAESGRITTELAGVVSFGPNFPSATITWDHENPDPDPWKHNQPTKDSAYIMTMDEGFKLTIKGRVLVTTQEAADVVKAMEIFSAPEPSQYPQEIYSSNAILLNAGGYILGDESTPDGLRRKADWLEKLAKAREQRATDLAWARSILELWKKKVEGAK